MKFLKTNDEMSFVEEELWSTYTVNITDDMLDLTVNNFIKTLSSKIDKYKCAIDSPVLFVFKCDELAEDDITYCKNMVYEILAECIRRDKVNSNWQPKITISNKLDMNMKAQNTMLNYNTVPNILNVKFKKNEKVLYNMIKE